jgi:hypothetical protein
MPRDTAGRRRTPAGRTHRASRSGGGPARSAMRRVTANLWVDTIPSHSLVAAAIDEGRGLSARLLDLAALGVLAEKLGFGLLHTGHGVEIVARSGRARRLWVALENGEDLGGLQGPAPSATLPPPSPPSPAPAIAAPPVRPVPTEETGREAPDATPSDWAPETDPAVDSLLGGMLDQFDLD